MKSIGTFVAFIAVLGLIGGIIWLGFEGFRLLSAKFNGMEDPLASIILVVSIVAILCTLIIAGAIRSVHYSGDRAIHPEKALLYSKFIEHWAGGSVEDKKDLQKIVQEIKPHMVMWASDHVLKQLIKLESLLLASPTDPKAVYHQAEKLVYAIRKDVGEKNQGIQSGSLLHLFWPERF